MGNSVQTAEPVAERNPLLAPPLKRPTPSFWLRANGWVLLLLVGWLYHSILYRLAVQWATDQDASHGFFVPAFALFVVWQNRDRLKSIRTSPSWTGLPIIVFALFLLVLGVLGVELFTERVSLLFLLAGIIILSRGWPLFRALLFPWAFLFLMVPLPAIILQQCTFPLQIFASKLATWLLQAVNIPASREGNVIYLPHITLQVIQACSGVRSLVSLITLAIIYGYLMENRNWVRVVLACAAVPIAIASNVFRIFVTGLMGELWDPDKAQGFYHEFQGWLVFVLALFLLFAAHRVINWIWKPTPLDRLRPQPIAPGTSAPQANPPRSWSARFLTAAVLMLATVVLLQRLSQPEVSPPREPLASLPMQFGNWSATDDPLDPETLAILGHGEFLVRNYVDSNPQVPWINLFIAYYPTQKEGDSLHTPRHCIFGAGYVPMQQALVHLPGPDGAFPVNRFVVEKGGERALVLYWFQAHARVVTNEYHLKYYLVTDSIRFHRSDGALIRFWTPMSKGESADAAQARIMALGSQIIPRLDNYIPR